MLVSELMTTALVTGMPSDLVDETLFEMKLASIRHLPVIDERGRLTGILSDRDVLLSLGTNEARTVRVGDIMSTEVETIAEDALASEALAIMLRQKIGSLPVVDSEGRLVGVITESDFLRLAHEYLCGPDAPELDEPWQS